MRTYVTFAAAIAVAGLAMPAVAQDSVSQNPGTFEGDALDPWIGDSQVKDFVVDLTPFTTSGGVPFGVAPLLKSSKTSTPFFSSLIGAQTISATEIVVPNFDRDYEFWDFPGGGVNRTDPFRGTDGRPNAMAQLITPTAEGDIRQFVTGFGEQGNTDGGFAYNGITSARVQYDKANPSRLYVTRVISATDGFDQNENNGALYAGTADAEGFMYFRGDSFVATGPDTIAGDNIYRVNLLGRSIGMPNAIGGSGPSDAFATDHLVNNSATLHPVPGNIPMDVAGRPVYIGGTFNAEHAHESAPGVVSYSTSHLLSANQRGNIATYKGNLLDNAGIATGAFIARDGGGATEGFNIYSVDANGAPVAGGSALVLRPAGTILDRFDNFMVGAATGGVGEFDHYHSQVGTQGGNGTIALGRDAQGRSLAAGITYITGSGNNDPFNAIVVSRFDPANPAGAEWGIGAYVDIGMGPNGVAGKPVYDDMGVEIGVLRSYQELGNPESGPSLSGVSFDGAGNIWFTGIVAFPDGKGGSFLNSTLLRGVYQPDVNGGFGYRLEKVISFFDEFQSQNTGLNYRVFGFEIVDNNSVNSGTFWSTNVKQCTWGDIDPSKIDPSDPRSTAGVVVSTSITYDVDGDGDFTINTTTDPTTIDEAYNVLLYIAPFEKAGAPPCPADLDGSGTVDSGDLAILLAAWGGTGVADLNTSGTVESGDLAILLAAWGPCPM